MLSKISGTRSWLNIISMGNASGSLLQSDLSYEAEPCNLREIGWESKIIVPLAFQFSLPAPLTLPGSNSITPPGTISPNVPPLLPESRRVSRRPLGGWPFCTRSSPSSNMPLLFLSSSSNLNPSQNMISESSNSCLSPAMKKRMLSEPNGPLNVATRSLYP